MRQAFQHGFQEVGLLDDCVHAAPVCSRDFFMSMRLFLHRANCPSRQRAKAHNVNLRRQCRDSLHRSRPFGIGDYSKESL
jgi:hypothetical protein